jgi:hypothetical protein
MKLDLYLLGFQCCICPVKKIVPYFTDEIGFAQNRSDKPKKPVSLPDFGPVYRFISKFSPIRILYRFLTGFVSF